MELRDRTALGLCALCALCAALAWLAGSERRAGVVVTASESAALAERQPTPHNAAAALACGVEQLALPVPTGQDLHGAGVLLAQWDEAAPRAGHLALRARVFGLDVVGAGDHSTHVAGTLIGDGSAQASGRGMAPAGRLLAFDWNNDLGELRTYAPYAAVAVHAYGLRMGWSLQPACSDQPSWLGRGGEAEDRAFGKYGAPAAELDRVLWETGLPSVWSAGNERQETGAAGGDPHYHAPDCSTLHTDDHAAENALQYDTLGLQVAAKNALVVGAVEHVMDPPPLPADVVVLPFSSFGPTDDGRIKPDLVASGALIYSSVASADDAYAGYSGTSSSAAVVAGGAALLTELQRRLNRGRDLHAEQLRALLIHTAARPASGQRPTYAAGWGAFDAEAAADVLSRDGAETTARRRVRLGSVSTEEPTLEASTGEVPSGTALRVTLAWTDPPGAINDAGVDDSARVLVNDLGLALLAPDGTVFRPWRLDPRDPAAAATRAGTNRVDNVEVVDVAARDNTWDGAWTVRVSAPPALHRGKPQRFGLVSSTPLPPLGGAALLGAPRSLLVQAPLGGPPQTVAVDLVSETGTELAWNASASEPWLELDALAGTAPSSLGLAVDPSGLAAGLHFGAIRIESDDPRSPHVLGVVLEVTCAPDCTSRACGTDPVCAVSCGGCGAGEACDATGTCMAWGSGCPAADLGSELGPLVALGSTQGAADDSAGSCGGAGMEDVAFAWTAPATARYRFGLDGSSGARLYVRDGRCDGTELACAADRGVAGATLGLALDQAETVVVVVEGAAGSGAFHLSVQPASCADVDLASRLGVALEPVQLAASIDRVSGTCGSAGAPDATFAWTAERAGSYRVALENAASGAVLYALAGDCGGAELGCATAAQGAELTLALAAGERMLLAVESATLGGGAGISVTAASGLCFGNCDGTPNRGACYCDAACVGEGDCCADACESCGRCCVPDCAGKACGEDGCGGSCGACATLELCDLGECIADPCAGAAQGASCDDDDACTRGDRCIGGRCAGSPVLCDDGDACTEDACNAATGTCETTRLGGCCAVDADCDDGDACTRDRCLAGSCAEPVRVPCEPDAGSAAGSGDERDSGAPDAGTREPPSDEGCGCRALGVRWAGPTFGWLAVGILIVARVGRRSRGGQFRSE